jgi:putative endonuclease
MRFPLSREVTMAKHNELGKKGEQLAVDYLISKGYTVVKRNYRFQKAEVDIIAKLKDTLAIVEVKTRSTVDFGNPQDFVKPKQIQRLVKAVDEYVTVNKLDVEVRFDIIAIVKDGNSFKIEHLEDAFYHF